MTVKGSTITTRGCQSDAPHDKARIANPLQGAHERKIHGIESNEQGHDPHDDDALLQQQAAGRAAARIRNEDA